MAVETNTIMAADLARVREKDFNLQFTGNIDKLVEALGVTRKEEVEEGTTLKVLKVTGTLESGEVPEGEIIPLSHYETTWEPIGELTLKKWRKGTTAEAILKKGYDQACGETTDKMVKDIQKGIRTQFFTFLGNTGSSSTASGDTLQKALADGWGQLQVLWEDDEVETVYFLHPLDIADYLGTAQISMQTVFGMNYIENFLGLGTVFTNTNVPQGTFYATAKENIIMYFINVASSELARQFNLAADETGYIGITEYPDKDSARVMDLVMSGITFFPERVDGVVVGTIGGNGAATGGDSDNTGGGNSDPLGA